MATTFDRVRWPDDIDAVVEFLVSNAWPFHGTTHLASSDAADIAVDVDGVASFWVVDAGVRVGLIRLIDLGDVDDGSPRFDLRLAEGGRGKGLGTQSVRWLTDQLFATFPTLHRVEATTRGDNSAMQAVFDRCGYRLEGRFVDAWRNGDGSYDDALSYAILRREWVAQGD